MIYAPLEAGESIIKAGYRGSAEGSLYRAANIRKNAGRVGANQLDRSNYDNQDHRKHYGIFGNVLALFVPPKVEKSLCC